MKIYEWQTNIATVDFLEFIDRTDIWPGDVLKSPGGTMHYLGTDEWTIRDPDGRVVLCLS